MLFGVLLFAFSLGLIWWIGGSLVAPANRVIGAPPADIPLRELVIRSKSGKDVAAWYAHQPGATATAVILHPIRGSRKTMLGHSRLFFEEGYTVLSIDMQAHGESPGEQITMGYLERLDVEATIEHVRSVAPDQKIFVVGSSLGGAATLLGGPHSIDALVLESVYPSIEQAVLNRVEMKLGLLSSIVTPMLTWQIKPRLGIELKELQPINEISKVSCPVMILAGENDQHTTLEESQRLFEAANEPKQIAVFDGAKHENLLKQNPEFYKSNVLPFLSKHLGTTNSRPE